MGCGSGLRGWSRGNRASNDGVCRGRVIWRRKRCEEEGGEGGRKRIATRRVRVFDVPDAGLEMMGTNSGKERKL